MNFHIVLVGLPGAGKSTVGRLVAREFDVEYQDIDEEIETHEGMSVSDIFSERGEAEFRRLEKLETERALSEPASVIAPGGGWAAGENNLENLPANTLTVYLKTTPQTAVARLQGSSHRPLLGGPDPLTRMIDLLRIRQSFYEKCRATVSTDGKEVDDVADEIVKLARHATGG